MTTSTEMKYTGKIKGRVSYSDKKYVYRSYKNKIFASNNSGFTWTQILTVYRNISKSRLIYIHSSLRRLFRYGVHHFHPGNSDKSCIIYDKKININQDSEVLHSYNIQGSRPLSLEYINNEFVYGEYRSNSERSEISIYAVNKDGKLYQKKLLSGIRHIHGIYQDPYTHKIWVTTGDKDEESAIYSADSQFKNMEIKLYGSQQTRTIKLLFTQKYIYFGTDAPDEINYIYRMDKISLETERLAQVRSSVFHGCKVGNWLFFSTAIEPSKVNKSRHAEIWASPDGSEWKCILRFKKDILPMKLFQYGQVFFPAGPGDGKHLWLSPFATEYDNTSFKIDLNQVRSMFDQSDSVLD